MFLVKHNKYWYIIKWTNTGIMFTIEIFKIHVGWISGKGHFPINHLTFFFKKTSIWKNSVETRQKVQIKPSGKSVTELVDKMSHRTFSYLE